MDMRRRCTTDEEEEGKEVPTARGEESLEESGTSCKIHYDSRSKIRSRECAFQQRKGIWIDQKGVSKISSKYSYYQQYPRSTDSQLGKERVITSEEKEGSAN